MSISIGATARELSSPSAATLTKVALFGLYDSWCAMYVPEDMQLGTDTAHGSINSRHPALMFEDHALSRMPNGGPCVIKMSVPGLIWS